MPNEAASIGAPEEAVPVVPSGDINQESQVALDALFAEVTGESANPEAEKEPPKEKAKPKEESKAAEKPPSPEAPAPKPEATPEVPATKDPLDEVELPPYSKPKSVEAFNEVKRRAREATAAKEAEIAALKKQVTERDEKLKAGLPPETAKELDELRTFRRSVDIENDPDFRGRFDGKIEQNNNAIYSKLQENGMTAAHIEEIKKLGGPEGVDWEPLFTKMGAPLKRFIEAKLVSNEDLREERKATIAQARKDPGVFEKQRQESQAKVLTETVNGHFSKMSWTLEKPVPANATPEEKAKIEAGNALAKQAQGLVQNALKDYNPRTFGELAVGTALAHKFKAELDATSADMKRLNESLTKVTEERDSYKTELDKIKKAGATHRKGSATPPPPPVDSFNISGQEALDRLKNELAA